MPGASDDGQKVLLHLAPGTKEDTASCTAFFEDLKRRGLADPLLVVTDGAPGLIRAVETCFPRALRQRCLVHRLRNLRSKAPESRWPEIALRARGCYEGASPALATVLRDDFVQTYARELPAVVQCFRDDFDACIAHLRFPLRHRRVIRTTNLLERLFLEERRRTKIIPNAFRERPVLKLMYAAVIRAAERWRGIAIGEFEHRQLRAIREELGPPAHPPSQAPFPFMPARKPIDVRPNNEFGADANLLVPFFSCDFAGAGDGRQDQFMATGVTWWAKSPKTDGRDGQWRYLL